MKAIRDIYPEEDGEFSEVCNYDVMIESFGYENILQVDDDDYQGDSRVIFRDGIRFGYLNFGWGSCSGCDSLQACSSYEELENLQRELHKSIKWYETVKDALYFFKNHDWEGDYAWSRAEQKEFIKKAKEVLAKQDFFTDEDFKLEV
jgi:hypothetical protein